MFRVQKYFGHALDLSQIPQTETPITRIVKNLSFSFAIRMCGEILINIDK